MLVLFETPAGYALFKLSEKVELTDANKVYKHFVSPEKAASVLKLKDFRKFEDTTAALSAATAICDGKLDESLRDFLSDAVGKKHSLAVSDSKLGGLIKENLSIQCIYDESIGELMRGIRSNINSLITGLSESDNSAMKLGLSHSLCRYKLKFSPDKVDVMIIQAISLLDELDKELNTYAMRVREWYGWHFPEMGRIVTDNILYAKSVRKMSIRTNAHSTDFSDILPEEMEAGLKEAAEVSMGTEIAEEDVENIKQLCDQVINISDYRASLYEYLKNRMTAIAPNLTVMVGELVGARLIAHAGSLLNLAKHPASTVQILGAEKALFRALKTKSSTPKYGLIYHASLVGQAAPKLKGKISRMLAAKTALSIRQDALGETEGVTIGFEGREKVELRLKQFEGGQSQSSSAAKGQQKKQEKYTKPNNTQTYNPAADTAMESETPKKEKKKDKKKEKENGSNGHAEEKAAAPVDDEEAEKAAKKAKKAEKKKRKLEEAEAEAPAPPAAATESDESAAKKAKKEKKKEKKAKKEKSDSD